MTIRLYSLAAICLALAPVTAEAAAWTSPKGHGQVILTTSYFTTSRSFNGSGKLIPFDYNGQFRKIEFNPYIEYGVTNRTSLLFNAFIPLLRFKNNFGSFESAGTGDFEVGFRHRLTPLSSRNVVSVQTLFLFPTYSANRNPIPGNHQYDIEPRLLVGRSYSLEKRSVFWDVEAGWRYRTGAPADQVRMDGSLGVDLFPRVALLGQVFAIKGLQNGSPISATTNPNVQSDFDLYKAQASAIFRVSRSVRFQVAYFRAVAGRGTGAGQGVLFSMWKNF